MENGVNENNEIKIEPTDNTNNEPVIEEAKPEVEETSIPVTEETTNEEVKEAESDAPDIEEMNKTNILGDNVKIAPAASMYDENDNVIEQPPTIEEVPPRPEIVQPQSPAPGEPPQIQIRQATEQVPAEPTAVEQPPTTPEQAQPEEPQKKRRIISLTPIFIVLIVLLGFGLFYVYSDKTKVINQLRYQNIVQYTDDKKVELDVNSTIVQDLYSKVSTTVREDIADPNLDDSMKRYLAYRQISSNRIYESNCNLFNQNKINNYVCDDNNFKPTAFKEETLQVELKKLFGETTVIDHGNIQLGQLCVGGYEYIEERGEYVEGQCIRNNAVTIKANKKIVSAYRINDEITIEEEVNYAADKQEQIPDSLQDGIYIYNFKLDTNFNYAYISKGYRTKY